MASVDVSIMSGILISLLLQIGQQAGGDLVHAAYHMIHGVLPDGAVHLGRGGLDHSHPRLPLVGVGWRGISQRLIDFGIGHARRGRLNVFRR